MGNPKIRGFFGAPNRFFMAPEIMHIMVAPFPLPPGELSELDRQRAAVANREASWGRVGTVKKPGRNGGNGPDFFGMTMMTFFFRGFFAV